MITLIGFGLAMTILFGHGGHYLIAWFIGIAMIPSIILVTFNILLFRKFKRIERSGTIVGKAGDGLRKSIFKVKMSMVISATFVASQITYWIYCSYMVWHF